MSIIVAACFLLPPGPPIVDAHTPHDPVSSVALSPGFAEDQTGFAVVDRRLVRTEDGFMSTVEITTGIGAAMPVHVTVAPSDASVVYVAAIGGDVYRSNDAGLSFRRSVVDAETPLGRVAVAADNPDVVVVAGVFGALYRSLDGGSSWIEVNTLGQVTELVASTSQPNRFYAGNAVGQLFVSDDGGGSWLPAPALGFASIAAIATSEDAQGLVVAVSSTGELARSDDGGITYAPIASTGLSTARVRDAIVSGSTAEGLVVWVANDDGVFRSDDGAATFVGVDEGLSIDPEAVSLEAPPFPSLAAHTDESGATDVVVGGFDGIFVLNETQDAWSRAETLADAITGIAVSPNFADDGTIAVTTYVKGVYISTDGGASFKPSSRGLDQTTGRSNTVLAVNRLQGVSFSPTFADDKTIFLATAERFAISTNVGKDWTRILVAPPPSDGPKTRHFAIGIGETIIGPTILLGSRQGVVYRSDRGGRADTWNATADVGAPVRTIVLSPQYGDVPELFLATTQQLYRSRDGGRSFEAADVMLRSAVVAMSPNYSTDRTVFAGAAGGLRVSRDGGTTWTPLGVVFGPNDVRAIAVSPDFATDSTLLVSLAGYGLFRSTDGGASFQPIAGDLLEQNLIIGQTAPIPTAMPLTYVDTDTVVAAASDSVLISNDGGLSWSVTPLPSYTDYTPPAARQSSDDTDDESGSTGDASIDTDATSTVDSETTQTPALPTADKPARDRKIWLLTGAIIIGALVVMIATARRRF